jgi:hypothetical protein
VKTTLEIPDATFRRAKSKAAERGVSLRQFVTEAVEDKLRTVQASPKQPWMSHMGKLKHLRKETARINEAIEDAFEQVDPAMWT